MSNPGASLEAWCDDGMAFTWGHGGAGRLGHGTVGAGWVTCVPHVGSGIIDTRDAILDQVSGLLLFVC